MSNVTVVIKRSPKNSRKHTCRLPYFFLALRGYRPDESYVQCNECRADWRLIYDPYDSGWDWERVS